MVTRRQHFVPCAYLQFFDQSGVPNSRSSKVYVSSVGGGARIATVDDVGFRNWTYSRIDSVGAEKTFHELEQDYPKFAKRMISNQDPGEVDGHLLSSIMLDMHLRNPAYKNRTEHERIKLYPKLVGSIIGELTAPGENPDLKTAGNLLKNEWSVSAITTDYEPFITSDSPTLMFASTGLGGYAIAMPISPKTYAFTFNTNKIALSSTKASNEDVGLLNGLQVRFCIRDVYSDHSIEGTPDWSMLQEIINRERPERYIDENSIRPNFVDPANLEKLSFIDTVND